MGSDGPSRRFSGQRKRNVRFKGYVGDEEEKKKTKTRGGVPLVAPGTAAGCGSYTRNDQGTGRNQKIRSVGRVVGR